MHGGVQNAANRWAATTSGRLESYVRMGVSVLIHEIKQHIRTMGKHQITTYSREIVSANIIEVEAGTNGYCGGDSGHGSRTYIRIENAGGTDLRVTPNEHNDGVILKLGGDCELTTIIKAFKFVIKVLRSQRKAYGKPYE